MAIDIRGLVETIVIVILENRSFDHMLGYLSLRSGANRPEIDGIISSRRVAYVNESAGQTFYPRAAKDGLLPTDLPHGRDLIKVQLDYSTATGAYTMGGFVEAYRQYLGVPTVKKSAEPMRFMAGPKEVPTMDFFAEHFTVCTRWFAPLPADTQPNRLMALSGFTTVDVTKAQLLDQPLVYRWLTERSIRWRVYRSGLPFCILLSRMWDDMLNDAKFRSIRRLAKDVQTEPAANFPQVIFCEPAYADSPVNIGFQPNDDHPPLPVAPGQKFLGEIYDALTSNPERWAKTVLIITYDEHGGFFDHVRPLTIPTDSPAGVSYPRFESTGVRVPSLVVSPLVAPGTVYDQALDHTSILQFVAERFGEGDYSEAVRRRKENGIRSVADVLTLPQPRVPIPSRPAATVAVAAAVLPPPIPEAKTPNQMAFEQATERFLAERRSQALDRYPELAQWEAGRRT